MPKRGVDIAISNISNSFNLKYLIFFLYFHGHQQIIYPDPFTRYPYRKKLKLGAYAVSKRYYLASLTSG